MKVLGKEDQRGKDMGHNIIKIPLRGRFAGQFAIVDRTEENFKLLERKWSCDKYGYPMTTIECSKSFHLHHFILPPNKNFQIVVDHKNGNKFDCRKENLRYVSRGENNFNTGKRRDCSNGYPGVYKAIRKNGTAKWYARISKHGKTINLGFFDTKKEAIVARRAAEITYYGYNLNIKARYGD